MSSLLRPAIVLFLIMTVITGVAYPLVVTGLSQPTSMAFLGPSDLLVLEKASGKVQRFVLRDQAARSRQTVRRRPKITRKPVAEMIAQLAR